MLITSITPVNASTVSNDSSENVTVIIEDATTAETTEEITSEKENTEVQDEKDVSTVDENTESQDAEEITVEEETTEIYIGETNGEESGISPLWLNPDHRDAQGNYVISQLGLNSNQASSLKEGATAPDSYYGETKGFHAKYKFW